MFSLAKAIRHANPVMTSVIALSTASFITAQPARAGCTQDNTPFGTHSSLVTTCTGATPTFYDLTTSAEYNTLTVFASTTKGIVSLKGSGSSIINTVVDAAYTCSVAGECDIVQDPSTLVETCTAKLDSSNNPLGDCIKSTPSIGPTGNSGPSVTVNINALTDGSVFVGSGVTTVAVTGQSSGSNGGNGGNSYVVGDAGDGGDGADGGSVLVKFTGLIASGDHGGLLAASLGGDGGNGGKAYGIGDGGNGGKGGFGGTAEADFLAGSIITTGTGNVGITAISRGGNAGDGGGSWGLGGTGGGSHDAGKAGTAIVATSVGTTISTSGDYAHGIAAYSLGGGGGDGGGGFGLFYSGGGGGSKGGNADTVTITSTSTIITTGANAQGILAQSIGGGGGNAATVAGLVSLGGSGNSGGMGGFVSVVNDGAITTHGYAANAIEAQSIGGGGGNGANSGGLFTMGGSGSGTTTGGAVTVANTALLVTYGSRSSGILVQSIGGGGGDGGTSSGWFAFGGSAGNGADGGIVSVVNSGSIITGANKTLDPTIDVSTSPGILAQSIGGGGGNGGGAISAAAGVPAAAFGGSGGLAGSGKSVSILRDGAGANSATAYNITTYGAASSAIIAQSIGGGGGNGGFAIAGSASPFFSVALGVGGTGAAGGDGDTVLVETKGSLMTYGLSSDGILAQSIGGGGGNGGFSVAASLSLGASLSVSLGGTGGAGGNANAVTVSSLSSVTTYGANSYGILAQSLGGGGGNGGFASGDSASLLGIGIGLGGKGDYGGSANTVSVTARGDIFTSGDNSVGIAAQSIGGGGGNGGFSAGGSLGIGAVQVNIGGAGTAGGIAQTANIDNSGIIFTAGTNAVGLLAQSLGGGGGNGGFAASGSVSMGGSGSVSVGGSGGAGQYSGAVKIDTDGGSNALSLSGYGSGWTQVTEGANSSAIVAQSIGGGGGNGGFAGSLDLAGGYNLGLSLGGSGGNGGYAASATVYSGYNRSFANNILTLGDDSSAIVVQSIGGGGGNGGFAIALTASVGASSAAITLGGKGGAGNYASAASAYSTGKITTVGNLSDGIVVQSIGGGGGNGGSSIAASIATQGYSGALAIGGKGGAGADADQVTLTNVGAVTTYGAMSDGLVAQSIGGGGGNGGYAGTASLSGAAVVVGLGGSGAGGGRSLHGVTLNNTGVITTYGNESSAIIAQSLGGGGGNGGWTAGLSVGALGSAAIAIGGNAGVGGSSSKVTVISTGDLTTGAGSSLGDLGNNAFGILAQSLGGGGGNGGFAGTLSLGGAVGIGVSVGGIGGGGGDGDAVKVTSTGNIATVFDNSGGILAQSIGGGGGNGGFSVSLAGSGAIEDIGAAGAVAIGGKGGNAGIAATVDVTSTGSVLTLGNYSTAIEAQSVGGGGGNGGFSVAGAATLGNAGIGVSVGGFGAGGGSAAAVSVTSYGTAVAVTPDATTITIETVGTQSDGILAQSLGGGGGNGGFAVGAGLAANGAGIGVSVGGFALGGGGAADKATVVSYNNILTYGFQSNAIAAQSIGGGGGDGGFAAAASAGSDFSGSVAVGGFSLSGGGKGSAVSVDSHGVLVTVGDESNAILAQSIGGGGGNGGFALSGAFTSGSAGLNASVGGKGAVGGDSDTVTVKSYGTAKKMAPASGVVTIATSGVQSDGILAQSIGGGGGNGGFAAGVAAGTGGSAFGASVGGFGAGGGDASKVSVTSYNNVETAGYQSNAIAAQSIGGGGGNGGFSLEGTAGSEFSGGVSVGGFALSGGGTAGLVEVFSYGILSTQGGESDGILAQSIGGGGGNGGFALSGTFSSDAGFNASVGGKGSVGGNGNQVTVDSYGAGTAAAPAANLLTISTNGDLSDGILAQSIGGGGGNGGFAAGATLATGGAALGVSVGGFGAGGGVAGTVTVTSYNNIATLGYQSSAIAAQSLGGGGGNGGFAAQAAAGSDFSGSVAVGGFALGGGGSADTVTVKSFGLLSTAGDSANGILAQSVGGGGGNGGFSLSGSFTLDTAGLSASIGGKGSNGGKGGKVVVVSNLGTTLTGNTATIQTTGDSANGIEAQSIGGGGGNGGFSGGFTATANAKASITLSVGGFGATGNKADEVDVTSVDNILTSGSGSNGILAQSLGGGGGSGGFSFAGTVSVPDGKSFSLSASLGGFGGSGGDAALVDVVSTGTIATSGNNADGVEAQSIGGGGGNGGLSVAGTFNFASENSIPSVTASVGGKGGSGGQGGNVIVARVGNTQTVGDQSVGILAQSIGGGGGNGGLSVAGSIGGTDAKQISASVGGFGGAGSNAGTVSVTNTGDIVTGKIVNETIQIAHAGRIFVTVPVEYGAGSDGILAQSIGGGGGNGGFSFAGSVGPTGENTSVNVGVSVGGFGGSGGFASTVTVINNGFITTYGADANGIEAQSIGGGGGNGGASFVGLLAAGDPQSGGKSVNVAVSVGGFGGSGNVAGAVSVRQSKGISTYGDGSNGILAQSIGGGGGNGGSANSLSLQLATSCTFTIPLAPQIGSCKSPKNASIGVQVDVGGFGGTGNDAGAVSVTNSGTIITRGAVAAGIAAQAIGGGGGKGGQAIVGLSGMFQDANYVDIATTVATLPIGAGSLVKGVGKVTVGGFGGAGGNGGVVTVNNSGAIQTAGENSYGIEAQSIGGGGGSGGNASSGVTGAVSIGGFGAASGSGVGVTVIDTLGADILTQGFKAHAIFAQSVGGGGGDGGGAGGLLALGGFGGASGGGGTVEVDNAAHLQTVGTFADGILAQSIGGGGGDGGGTGLSGISLGGLAGVLGSIGDGGTVTVKNADLATILTQGAFAYGIEAQSVGGGGGNGGGSTLGSAIAVGGWGGSAGKGGLVQVFNDGQIETDGNFSFGILAQSVGGSGGSGGGTIVSAVSVGGYGGSAGAGGEVDVTNTNLVKTLGLASDAIRAQSVGGGGGNASGVGQSITNGGLGLGLLISVGGGGGGGGNGGIVGVTNTGVLETLGDAAAAIRAQSVGGGGGDGGSAIGLLAIGGSNGNWGDGGAVTVTNKSGGTILTKGVLSDGIFAQSLGGGGGTGGGAFFGQSIGFATSIGGTGGAGGNGGSVLVTNNAQVETDGLDSTAIYAQSVGGGGGAGGVAGVLASLAAAPSSPTIGIAIGGNGGAGGNGGTVTVNNTMNASIVTKGTNSTAIFAQSVGGGGGDGGFVFTIPTLMSGTVGVSLGGANGAGGNGAAVSVTNAGSIVLNGKDSIAIVAQSVGGGGGTASAELGVSAVPVTIGGQSGANGTGGNVHVANTGTIIVNGDNSIGIFAQSVGGGGGLVKPGGGVTSVLTAKGGIGNGGTVTIDNTAGSIVINGANSIALYSQSVGGGGGAVGLDSDPPGQVGAFLFSGTSGGSGAALATTVNQTGNLIATGLNSIALAAQSSASGGKGDITVNVLNPASGLSYILGGLGSGAAVEILDGANNTFNNAGVIAALPVITGTVTGSSANDGTLTVTSGTSSLTIDGTRGYAVIATGGANTTVNNTGLMMGSIDLGALGVNAINNQLGAVFDSGAIVALGTAGTLTNSGVLAPGGYYHVFTTAITGKLVQTATGVYGLDLDLKADTSDQITVSGTAAMSGVVLTNIVYPLVAPGYALPGTHAKVILSAAGGVSHTGLVLQAFNTAVATYSLVYPDSQKIDLQYVIDYSPTGLTTNQHALGNVVNTIQTVQISPTFRPIAVNLFYLPDVPTLGTAYDLLSGEGVAALEQASFDSNEAFLTAVGAQVNDWFAASRTTGHSWHLWLSPYGNGAIYGGDKVQGASKVRQSGYGIAGGLDYQVSQRALIGVAIGGGSSWVNIPGRATKASLDSVHVGVYGGWNGDAYYASGAFGYDAFQNSEARTAVIPGVTLPKSLFVDGPYTVPGYFETPDARFHSSGYSGHVEAGYHYDLGIVQATPFARLTFGSLTSDAFTETNANQTSVIGLSFDRHSVASLPSQLGVRFDSVFDLGADLILRSWLDGSWKHEFDTSRTIQAEFISAPGFVFQVHGAEPAQEAGVVDTGVRLTVDNTVSMFANFTGTYGGPNASYAGTAGISIRW